MVIVFGVYGFDQETIKLQPWLTIREVGIRLVNIGWEVHVITDAVNTNSELDGIKIHKVDSLRQTNSAEVVNLITSINPAKLILLSSPLNLVGDGWFADVSCDIYAFLSYPFYTRLELMRAMPFLTRQDALFYARYLVLPNFLWQRTIRRHFKGLIAQSERTVRRVASTTGNKLNQYNIHAGIDLDFWSPKKDKTSRERAVINFLYVGSAKSIRGFDILLKAFSRMNSTNARLKILARGSGEAEEEQHRQYIENIVKHKSMNIELEGGWIDRETLRSEIQDADCVVLPFVLVPSELPVSVIECIACGTPVIATDINGLPEAIGAAGIIVKQASTMSLSLALDDLCASADMIDNLTQQCYSQRKMIMSWDEVTLKWKHALS